MTASTQSLFLFNDDDLAANRRGELTERQRNRLIHDRRFTLVNALGNQWVYTLTIVAVFLSIIGNPLSNAHGSWAILLLLIPALISYLIVVIPLWIRLSSDLSKGTVETITGFTQLATKIVKRPRGGDIKTDYIKVGAHYFRVSPKMFNQLKLEPTRYRAYYAPRSNSLLSLERFDS